MEITQEVVIRKPISEVWEILGNQFGEAHKWASGLYHSQASGTPTLPEAHCSQRSCQTSIGSIREKLIAFDPGNHLLSYKVVEGFPSYMEEAINTWSLHSDSEGTRVKMHLRMSTRGILGALMSPMMKMQMKSITSTVINDFRHYVETAMPSPEKIADQKKHARKATA